MCFHYVKHCHQDNGTQILMVIFSLFLLFILTIYQEDQHKSGMAYDM